MKKVLHVCSQILKKELNLHADIYSRHLNKKIRNKYLLQKAPGQFIGQEIYIINSFYSLLKKNQTVKKSKYFVKY